MIQSAIEDVRTWIFLILIVIVAASIFGVLKESTTSEEAKEVIEQTEQSFWTSINLIIVGIGIIGTIGLIILIVSWFKQG
ncbi:MAG TPA: hypothetical protein HA346_01210 [Thermoplasmata archaeon]|nr:hypothetical protein [Thermoplasmata archaeon]